MPLFTNVLEEGFSEVRIAPVLVAADVRWLRAGRDLNSGQAAQDAANLLLAIVERQLSGVPPTTDMPPYRFPPDGIGS